LVRGKFRGKRGEEGHLKGLKRVGRKGVSGGLQVRLRASWQKAELMS